MDNDQQILDELRTHTAMLKGAIRAQAIVVVWVGVLVVLVTANLIFGDRIADAFAARTASADSWRDARRLVDKGELPKAREMISRLIAKNPRNFFGYRMLGFVEQEAGNVKESEANFARAWALFPSEENEKNLAAIRKVTGP